MLGYVGTVEDITKIKHAEQELAKNAVTLARSNAELEEFAYVASHDLQEPLRKILAWGDRLKATCGAGLTEQSRGYIERMLNAAQRMRTLITILGSSRFHPCRLRGSAG